MRPLVLATATDRAEGAWENEATARIVGREFFFFFFVWQADLQENVIFSTSTAGGFSQPFLLSIPVRSVAMLSSAPLRPARPASSIANSTTIRSAGVGSVSPSGKRAASETPASIIAASASASATPNTSTSSSKTSKRTSVIAAAAPKKAPPPKKKGGKEQQQQQQIPVDYGRDWFAATRDPSRGLSPRQEMERRREANRAANNGLERKDLYTDAWAGSEYRGSGNNIVRGFFLASFSSFLDPKAPFLAHSTRPQREKKKRKTKNEKQLTWLIVASVAAPTLGLLFAWQTYGTLWG